MKLTDLKPAPYNPRTITEEALQLFGSEPGAGTFAAGTVTFPPKPVAFRGHRKDRGAPRRPTIASPRPDQKPPASRALRLTKGRTLGADLAKGVSTA